MCVCFYFIMSHYHTEHYGLWTKRTKDKVGEEHSHIVSLSPSLSLSHTPLAYLSIEKSNKRFDKFQLAKEL